MHNIGVLGSHHEEQPLASIDGVSLYEYTPSLLRCGVGRVFGVPSSFRTCFLRLTFLQRFSLPFVDRFWSVIVLAEEHFTTFEDAVAYTSPSLVGPEHQ